jgi:hypothetical protein
MSLIESHFRDWLQGLVIVADDDALVPYRAIVNRLLEEVNPQRLLGLVAYAYDPNRADPATASAVTEACRAEVDTWTDASQLERVLGAAVVASLLESGCGARATVAALGATSATFAGATPLIPELPELARNALDRLADDARLGKLQFQSLKSAFDNKIGGLPADEATPATMADLRETNKALRAAGRAMAEEADAVLRGLVTASKRVSEELDLLWWTHRPFSSHLAEGWHGAKERVAVVGGLEIARRIRVDPPPRGLDGLILEALSGAGVTAHDTLTLAEISAANTDDLPLPATDESTAWACPVLRILNGAAEGDPDITPKTVTSWTRQLVNEICLLRASAHEH